MGVTKMHRLSAKQIEWELKKLAEAYPDMTRLLCEGESTDARPIYSLTAGNGNDVLICTGGVHGRESINPTVLVEMLKEYCAACTKDSSHILNRYRLCVIPLLNPDGYEIALQGFDAVRNAALREMLKSSDISARDWKANARGADLNRNFPCQSYRKQSKEDAPLSEVESRLLTKVFEREKSIGYIDFHSRGREIYWYRGAMNEQYNKRQKEIAHCFARVSGYMIGRIEQEMPDAMSGGNTVQYYSERYEMPAITVETVEEEAIFPLSERWLPEVYHEIKEIPLAYLVYAAQGYFPSERMPFR